MRNPFCMYLIIPSLLFSLHLVAGLDLNWIPAEDDGGPLPLSKSYRDSLRRLCDILDDSGVETPPEILGKRAVVERLCMKLKTTSDNGESGAIFNALGNYMGYVIAGVVSIYMLWNLYKIGSSKVCDTMDSFRVIPSVEDVRQLRQQRFDASHDSKKKS